MWLVANIKRTLHVDGKLSKVIVCDGKAFQAQFCICTKDLKCTLAHSRLETKTTFSN